MRQLGKAAKKLRLAGGIGVDLCARKNRRFHIDAPDAHGLPLPRYPTLPKEGNGDCDTRDGLATLSWSPMAIEHCVSDDAGSRAVRGLIGLATVHHRQGISSRQPPCTLCGPD